MLKIHKPKRENYDITTIRTSPESHLDWKKQFHKNLLYFTIYADFEADNETDNTCIGIKTSNIYKQNPVLNGYEIVSELEDVLKSGHYKSRLDYDNVDDWFVDQVIKVKNKLTFFSKNTRKDIIMTEEDEKDFKNNNTCQFCEKKY